MKVFFIQTASKMDHIVSNDINILNKLTFQDIIRKYISFGFSSLFGMDRNLLFNQVNNIEFFSNVTNSL